MNAPATDADADGILAARALAGDQRAFARIVALHKRPLFAAIMRIVGDEGDALDVVQDTFVTAHGALGRYDPARPMRGWLMRIAINKARDWRRRRLVRRLFNAVAPVDGEDRSPDPAPAPDIVAADRQELARVARAIDALPPRLREVLVLRTIEGYDQAETARMLSIGGKAVETRLYRARRALTAALADPPR